MDGRTYASGLRGYGGWGLAEEVGMSVYGKWMEPGQRVLRGVGVMGVTAGGRS